MLCLPFCPPASHSFRLSLSLLVSVGNAFGPSVQRTVRRTPNHLQVLRAIVKPVMILMMNILAGLQAPTQKLLHHVSMLSHVFIITHMEELVTMREKIARSMPDCFSPMPGQKPVDPAVPVVHHRHFATAAFTRLRRQWHLAAAQLSNAVFGFAFCQPHLVALEEPNFTVAGIFVKHKVLLATTGAFTQVQGPMASQDVRRAIAKQVFLGDSFPTATGA